MSTDLGRELKWWVRRGPRSQKVGALAARIGVSQSTLYAYLAGTTVPPSEVLDELLHTLGVPPEEQRRLATAHDELRGRRRTPVPDQLPDQQPDRAPDRAPIRVPVPRELPPDPAGFTGRDGALADLNAALLDGLPEGTAPRIGLVCGPAGVGKTALALHWGHRVRDRFPDGCLYVDLRGWSVDEPLAPDHALGGFLRSLGVEDASIPPGAEARTARFRSLLSGRRMLVVLDNALEADQVRGLLPGDPGCFVVVTSRSQLPGVLVSPGARRVELHPLPTHEAVALLEAQLPEAQLPEEGDRGSAAAHALAERCGGLPLALRVAAAQASSLPGLDALVTDLDERPGLDRFDVGDRESSVRRVFSWSERRLSSAATTAFRLLGVAPVPDLDVGAAAALFGAEASSTRDLLDELVHGHLVTRSPEGRYGMHDLLHRYAHERARDGLSRHQRSNALHRLVTHLGGVGRHAVDVLHPPEDHAARAAAGAHFGHREDAQAWLDREWTSLMALVERTCREDDQPELARELVAVLRPHLDQGGRHHDALVVLNCSLTLDRRIGDESAEAVTLRDLGTACMRVGRHEEATEHFGAALELARRQGDRNCVAGTLNNLGNLFERLGRCTEAIAHYEAAVPVARALDSRRGEATLHNNLGCVRLRLGDPASARQELEQALELFEGIGDLGGAARARGNLGRVHLDELRYDESLAALHEALVDARAVGAAGIETETRNNLGRTLLATGSAEHALDQHRAALAMARDGGDRYEEALALEGIGRAHRSTGAPAQARGVLEEALAILASLGLQEASRVSAALADLDTRVAP